MVCVVGVRFKMAGKVYYFDPADLSITAGNKVIVETVRGVEYGEVVVGPKDVEDDQVVQPLKKVIRIGTERDTQIADENKRKEKEAFGTALKKIEAHNLDMYLVDVEYTFDGSKIIFYFTAEGRIDFRELVRDLAGVFRTRIEMRQIGVRDEAKLLGGIGPCGRVLCCTSFLGDFAPVSIRMAKDQNLSLNPSKISGLCGRLMCCLRYEQDTYEAAKKDPTLAPGYVPPMVFDPQEPMLDDAEEERPTPAIGVKNRTPSGFSARIAQAAVMAEQTESPRGRPPRPVSDRDRQGQSERLGEGRPVGQKGQSYEGRRQFEQSARREPRAQGDRPGQPGPQVLGGKPKPGRQENQNSQRPQEQGRKESKGQVDRQGLPQQSPKQQRDRQQGQPRGNQPQPKGQQGAPRPFEQAVDRPQVVGGGGPAGEKQGSGGNRRRRRRRGPRPEGGPAASSPNE